MMKSVLFRRSLIAAAVVAVGVGVYGCGGGEIQEDRTAAPAEVVEAEADVRSAVLVVGGGSGVVAQALSAGLKPGSEAAFDVLVVDASGGEKALALAEAAIESGKRVVVDGAGEANAALALKLGGMSPDADAVMIMKSQDHEGYVVVPIDSAPNAAKRKAALQAANPSVAAEDLPVNTVQSVFGL